MDVFDLRNRLVSDYRSYTRSFIKIRDARIEAFVDGILGAGGFWPEPLLQLNPTFRPGGTIDELVELGILHRECAQVFRIDKSDTDHRGKQLLLHQHQREAIRSNPPDILLTNYMMLELLLTRSEDRELVRAAQGLRFLVFDELHTYRGPPGRRRRDAHPPLPPRLRQRHHLRRHVRHHDERRRQRRSTP